MTHSSPSDSPSPQAWRGAAFGVFLATLFLIALSTLDLIQNNVSLGDATIYFVAGSLITALFGAMLVFIWILFANISPLSKWAIACFALIVYYFFIPTQTSTGMIFIGIWTIASCSLACGSFWSFMTNHEKNPKNRLITLSYLFLGIFGMTLLAFWLLSKNPTFSPPATIESHHPVKLISLSDPALPGPFPVKTLSYGNGTDVKRPEYGKQASMITESVNAKPFIEDWKGISGWLRTRYWGFDPSHIPLNAKVWYPEGEGSFPLVFIVHGNHEMSAPSENGYTYLATLFASRGFIVASIDQNFLNGGWIDFTGSLNEVTARGWLILEHLKLWREWNKDKSTLFFNKVDMNKIALIGHSRGGEAIVTAAAFNELDYYPDNGNISFDYHFNIRALAAIAPVDAQYTPGGQKTSLNNINYLVIQGAHDGDVRSFEGNAQYRRIHFNDSEYHFKASLYVFGANHGQFNSVWGLKDTPPPSSLLFNLNQFLPQKEQQQIAKVYLTAFLETSLHGEKEYLPLFHTWRAGKEWLPKTLYFNEFNDSKEFFITNEETTNDLGKTTHPGGIARGEHLKIWRKKQMLSREGTPTQTGIFLGWNSSPQKSLLKGIPSYTIQLPKDDFFITSKSILILSLADDGNDDHENIDENPIDFTIELVNTNGEKASLPLSHDALLQPSIKLHLMKSDFLDPLEPSESIFQTFEFPLQDFIEKNSHFDPSLLHSIRLIFNKTENRLIILNSISIRNDLPSSNHDEEL